ncbi:MAG TPA: aromatic ring-hydroxylating dioxygenase subunit alpha [Candidatus Binatia bacterium]|nr:aromatic ring-hydroxylating dioxygenase subunit alpha [Candidatus Binatia bacterium]
MAASYTLWRHPEAPDWRRAVIRSAHYTSPERLAREQEKIFATSWQLAGRTDDLAAPGDWLTCEIAGESVLVVNAGSAGLRAHHNVCRHRGRELLGTWSCGRAKNVQCPYHGWTYELDGRLRGVPDAETFPDLDRAALGLRPVELEVWRGFVFVRLTPGGAPLLEHLEGLDAVLPAAFEPAVLVARRTFELEANWKTVVEAFIETNHVASLHPRVGKGLRFAETAVAHFPRHSLTVVPTVRAADWTERQARDWTAWVTDPSTSEIHYSIFPNLTVHLFALGLTFLFRYLPDRRDPERTRLDVWTWMRVREGETPPAPMSMPEAMGQVFQQDYDNIAMVQRGVRSRAFDGPRLNVYESRIGHFHAVLARALGEPA